MSKEKETVSKPSSEEQWSEVRSGFRIAGFMILYFLTAVILIRGTLNVRGNPDRNLLIGLAEIGVGTAVLIATAKTWLRWLSALTLIGAVRALVSIPMGAAVTNPQVRISPLQGLELAAWFLVVCALSVRFISSRPNHVDKVAAVVLVYSFLWGAFEVNSQRYLLPGVIAMAAAWLWSRRSRRNDRSGVQVDH